MPLKFKQYSPERLSVFRVIFIGGQHKNRIAHEIQVAGFVTPSSLCKHMSEFYAPSSKLYRKNADDCRQRATQASTTEGKAGWLKIAEEWQKLSEEMEAVEAKRQGD